MLAMLSGRGPSRSDKFPANGAAKTITKDFRVNSNPTVLMDRPSTRVT